MEDDRESKIICRKVECRYHKEHRKRGAETESQKQCGIAVSEKGREAEEFILGSMDGLSSAASAFPLAHTIRPSHYTEESV